MPYDVVVTANALHIRSNPVNGAIIDTVQKGTILTVWAEENKTYSKWGKNSKGYFCLKNENGVYVKNV